ncbi:hypothetical protein HPB48_018176 [Haemaphysalis longicornis]|uniref:Uncharacterized protein n=1 Tax=Haemaphysalis longicornis TaxID=44386 RepID=A0A9J6FT12_HAELO|nr:hypothetical protein HPB48_018176 [Haemaphysalis longicornis]
MKPARRSASFAKLGERHGGASFDVDGASKTGYRLINLALFLSCLQNVAVCKKCNKGEITLEEAIDRRSGSASFINVTGSECDAFNVLETSRRTSSNIFEVNKTFVYALRNCGKGLASGRTVCVLCSFYRHRHQSLRRTK